MRQIYYIRNVDKTLLCDSRNEFMPELFELVF